MRRRTVEARVIGRIANVAIIALGFVMIAAMAGAYYWNWHKLHSPIVRCYFA